jgi:hypothetical protein
MTKRNKVIYWIATIWLALGMTATGIVQLGAVFSHLAVGDAAMEFFGPTLLIVLTVVSWYFRPADRKLTPVS